MSQSKSRPPLSIGVVTHDRATAFSKLLKYLLPAIERYGQRCEVIVANNSGPAAHALIEAIVVQSGIRAIGECRVIESSKNNISTGRNCILEHAREVHLVFVDDDEYPVTTWLEALVDSMHSLNCTVIAGPILPVFPKAASSWVQCVDLHNTHGLVTGDRIDYAASGNFLINLQGIEDSRFGEAFGKSGGEDTEFFLQLKDKGHHLYWCKEAIVYEDIPESKATYEYMIQRFMTQGRTYRTIKEQREEIRSLAVFTVRAAALAVISILLGRTLLRVKPRSAAKWMKRGYSNLGKVIKPVGHLYE